jgi:hypothetical protein
LTEIRGASTEISLILTSVKRNDCCLKQIWIFLFSLCKDWIFKWYNQHNVTCLMRIEIRELWIGVFLLLCIYSSFFFYWYKCTDINFGGIFFILLANELLIDSFHC